MNSNQIADNTVTYTFNGVQASGPVETKLITTNRFVPNHTGIVGTKKVFLQQEVTLVGGETFGCVNPHNQLIPVIKFNPECSKCKGTGAHKSMFSSKAYPCYRCYSHAGYCVECYGTAIDYKKGKACGNCKDGKRLQR